MKVKHTGRNHNVRLEAMGEISLRTKTIANKRAYKRKIKHKGTEF